MPHIKSLSHAATQAIVIHTSGNERLLENETREDAG
jgi:hypothetical protein